MMILALNPSYVVGMREAESGPQRTPASHRAMSAIGVGADMGADPGRVGL